MSRKRKWVLAAAIGSAMIVVLLMIARSSRGPGDSLRPVYPLPSASAMTIPFELVTPHETMISLSYSMEQIYDWGRETNFVFADSFLPGRQDAHGTRDPVNVTISPNVTAVRVRRDYLTPSALKRAVWKLPKAAAAKLSAWRYQPDQLSTIWSPWLVKTNGMWVEMGADYKP